MIEENKEEPKTRQVCAGQQQPSDTGHQRKFLLTDAVKFLEKTMNREHEEWIKYRP